jgi:hypothetical protein
VAGRVGNGATGGGAGLLGVWGVTVRPVDTDPAVAQQLLRHAERQTKALENINYVLMIWFVVSLLAAAVWILTTAVA